MTTINGRPSGGKDPRHWAFCEECKTMNRPILGTDSTGAKIIAPCYECTERKKPK